MSDDDNGIYEVKIYRHIPEELRIDSIEFAKIRGFKNALDIMRKSGFKELPIDNKVALYKGSRRYKGHMETAYIRKIGTSYNRPVV